MEWNACKGRNRNGHTVLAPGKKRRPSKLQHSKANAHALFFSVKEQPYIERSSSTLAAQSLAGNNRALHKPCGRSEDNVFGHFSQQGLGMGDLGGTSSDLCDLLLCPMDTFTQEPLEDSSSMAPVVLCSWKDTLKRKVSRLNSTPAAIADLRTVLVKDHPLPPLFILHSSHSPPSPQPTLVPDTHQHDPTLRFWGNLIT